ncbi:hypothetical protein BGZ97_006241, partial [Linnemannia gamsii]
PTVTVTATTPASDSTSSATTVSPAATTTVAPAGAIAKRQAASILETGPLDQSPEQIEAWLKAMVNNLAVNEGLPAPY